MSNAIAPLAATEIVAATASTIDAEAAGQISRDEALAILADLDRDARDYE